jgi:hypothetical protein
MATSQDPLSRARLPITISSNILHRVSIPKYAAELGVDPQADFVNRPESQGLLGSAVLCFPFRKRDILLVEVFGVMVLPGNSFPNYGSASFLPNSTSALSKRT